MSIDLILEPFQYGFMVRAFVGTGLVAIVAAAVGTFVVLKGIAFMGDAIAHTSFTGIALALILGISVYVGALLFALLTALGVIFLTRVSKVNNDTALAILFTGVFALGIVLLAGTPGFSGDLNSLLLGSVMAIQTREILLMAALALLLAILFVVFFERFVLVSFDPVGAEAAGFPVVFVQSLLLTIVAATIVISIQAVGVVLVVALLITPAATAGLLTKRLKLLILLSSALGLFSSFCGLYVSYFFGAPPGATVVLVATLVFALALGVQKLRRV
ncbi:MAG: metal ABC transporter permease [Bacillota bacterium]|jgi:manganese/iron transport system permease protein|nr:metal ABC transporter permease [Bacillota bacterium]HHT91338.1 metal ABC transporter permease [Bacillota bacterium]